MDNKLIAEQAAEGSPSARLALEIARAVSGHLPLVTVLLSGGGILCGFLAYVFRCGQASQYGIDFRHVGEVGPSGIAFFLLGVMIMAVVLSVNAIGYLGFRNRHGERPIKRIGYAFGYPLVLVIIAVCLLLAIMIAQVPDFANQVRALSAGDLQSIGGSLFTVVLSVYVTSSLWHAIVLGDWVSRVFDGMASRTRRRRGKSAKGGEEVVVETSRPLWERASSFLAVQVLFAGCVVIVFFISGALARDGFPTGSYEVWTDSDGARYALVYPDNGLSCFEECAVDPESGGVLTVYRCHQVWRNVEGMNLEVIQKASGFMIADGRPAAMEEED